MQIQRPKKRGPASVGFKMRKAGTDHKEWFLGSTLYLLKMSMLGNKLHHGMGTLLIQTKIDNMAEFIALFYGPLFLQAGIGAYAPRLDLELWHNMITYKVRNIVKL